MSKPSESIAAIEASLRRRFRVVANDVLVGNRRLSILHPESAEALIDEQAFSKDERLPYWAELWPSAHVLGDETVRASGTGRTLLELGCGSGLVSTCASLAGFEVTASDYYEDAIRFARVNAVRNSAPPIRGLHLDWRNLPLNLPRFDVVLASDVLYERPYGTLVARVIAATLAPDGRAFLADPGRVGREPFVESLGPLGLEMVRQTRHSFTNEMVRQTIVIFEIASRT